MPKVYFLAMHNPADSGYDFRLVKVGVTDSDVAARLAQLQTGNPYELRCLGSFETSCAREVEHFVHRTHAAQMHNLEWLRWPRDEISTLMETAQTAARRFEDRKTTEDAVKSQSSNGQTRRAESDEIKLHREARALIRELVPAKLRLEIATNQLKAATGATHGIEGVVRVKYVPAAIRFSAQRAQAAFPALASRCSVEDVQGRFIWTKVPRPSRFVAENLAAKETAAVADAAATAFLASTAPLQGWTPRTPETERIHDGFLRAMQIVHRLAADLADLRSELTIRMGDHDAVEPVCSFKRMPRLRIDADAFCAIYPNEAAQCAEPVAAQLRKSVYPTRSYL